MKTADMFHKMAAIAPHVAAIVDDDEAHTLAESLRGDGFNAANALRGIFPLMLGKHREDLYAILAEAADTTPEDVAQMEFSEVKALLSGGLVDDFFAFSTSLLRMVARA